jgi:hypothetical protein
MWWRRTRGLVGGIPDVSVRTPEVNCSVLQEEGSGGHVLSEVPPSHDLFPSDAEQLPE